MLKIIPEFVVEYINVLLMAVFMTVLLFKLRKEKMMAGYLLIYSVFALILLYFFSKDQRDRVNKLVYCIEYMHIPLILFLVWKNRTAIGIFIGRIDGIEIFLFVGTAVVNLAAIAYLFFSNHQYIYPCNTTGIIGNYYYNADPGRGITYALTNVAQSNVHSLYRFVLNPFLLPCVILFHILGHPNWILGGYYIAILQAFLNSVSALVFFRLIMECTCNRKYSLCFTFLYVVSGAYIWTTILPETYSLAVCLLLITLYLFQRNAAVACASAVLSAGINPILSVAYVPFLYKRVKDYFAKNYKLWILPFAAALYLAGSGLFHGYIEFINQYRETGFNLPDQIRKMWISIFTAGFLGPRTIYVGPYFFQKITYSFPDIIFSLIVVIALLSVVKMRKDRLIQSATMLLVSGIILHGIIGFGVNYGFIYSPLYIPAILILLSNSVVLYKKGWFRNSITAILIILTCMHSGKWLYTLGRDLDKVAFPISEWSSPANEMRIGTVKFRYTNHTLSFGEEIMLTNIDSILVSESGRRIVGTLHDGTIYVVMVDEDRYAIQYIQ